MYDDTLHFRAIVKSNERKRERKRKREVIDFFPRFATSRARFLPAIMQRRDGREGEGERDGGGGAGAALVPVAQPHYLRSSLRRLGN